MKLLFDQNLSFRLCKILSDIFPASDHVGRLGLSQSDDAAIWTQARQGGFVLVSKDADFADMAMLRGAPPKIIWLRCGNVPTAQMAALIRAHQPTITAFGKSDTAVCLEIYE
jgi:predicted nuclease of predicted toxin-antitoxin system